MGTLERAAELVAPPALNFPAHGIEHEAAAVSLPPVDLGDEFGRQGDGNPGGRHEYDHTIDLTDPCWFRAG